MVSQLKARIYRSQSPADIAAYSLKEAAHHVQLPLATVRSWVMGRRYRTEAGERVFQPLLKVSDPQARLFSFRDLAELHVLGAVRREHQIRMPAVRKAIAFLRKTLQTRHPLSCQEMLTDGKDLFITRYGQLVSASESGQMALREVLDLYLQRIERGDGGVPARLYPFTRLAIESGTPRAVVIDPEVQFGRPCVTGTGIPTGIIMERYRAGDSIDELARDYRCSPDGIEEAIRYETAA